MSIFLTMLKILGAILLGLIGAGLVFLVAYIVAIFVVLAVKRIREEVEKND